MDLHTGIDLERCLLQSQKLRHCENTSRATATLKSIGWALSVLLEEAMCWVTHVIVEGTVMYQSSRTTLRKWFSTKRLMRESERERKRIYLLYGSSEVGNMASHNHAKDAGSSARKLA